MKQQAINTSLMLAEIAKTAIVFDRSVILDLTHYYFRGDSASVADDPIILGH